MPPPAGIVYSDPGSRAARPHNPHDAIAFGIILERSSADHGMGECGGVSVAGLSEAGQAERRTGVNDPGYRNTGVNDPGYRKTH